MTGHLTFFGRRVKPRFIIFLFLFVCINLWAIKYLTKSSNASYTLIKQGSITMEDKGESIIIRQEMVYNAPHYGKAIFHVDDGSMIQKDDLIATIYKSSYEEELIYQLYSIQEKINKYQQENIINEISDKDLDKINNKISDTLVEIQFQVRDNRLQKLDNKERQVRNLLFQRQRIIDKKSKPDDYLKQLLKEEKSLTEQLNDWKVAVKSPKSGIISFYLDGLEQILNDRSINNITVPDFKELVDWQLPTDVPDQAKAEQPFFRIIDPTKWYIVYETKLKHTYFEVGDSVQVTFPDINDKAVKGKVTKIINDKNSNLIVLEFQTDVENFINVRDTSININKEYDGLMVPLGAIVERKGEKGVIRLEGSSHSFIKIRVQACDGKNAIIKEKNNSDKLNINDQVQLH